MMFLQENGVRGWEFHGYEIVERLKVMVSGEAELFLVQRKSDSQRFVLKRFHFGEEFRTKAEVLDMWKKLDRAHVPVLVEHGEEGGRYFEVLEYISGGSLAQWLATTRLTDEQVLAVVKELAGAIDGLHGFNILHRDIKPANVLIRSFDPLDLVLTDFGISSVSDLDLHQTIHTNRTVLYASPEAITKIISKTSDWWSLGIILLEMLNGAHPMAKVAEHTITLQLVSRGIEIPKAIKEPWRLLLRGLLTRDFEKRWGSEQVTAWLAGKRDIPVYYEESDSATIGSAEQKGFKFLDKQYNNLQTLALAMANNWREGVTRFARGYVCRWIEQDLKDTDLANQLADIQENTSLDGDQRLMIALLIMNRDLPLTWKGELVTRDWMEQNAILGVQLLNSAVPIFYKRFRNDNWLVDVGHHCARVVDNIEKSGIPLNLDLAKQLLLHNPEKVLALARESQSRHMTPELKELRPILRRKNLSIEDAIILLTCERKLLGESWESIVKNDEIAASDPKHLKKICKSHRAIWEKAEQRGLPAASFLLGLCRRQGFGESSQKDTAAAENYFRIAASLNHPAACFELGRLLEETRTVHNGSPEAAKWYLQAAELGHSKAQYRMAELFQAGGNGQADLQEAYKWFLKAALTGHTEAMIGVAICYREGIGCGKDMDEGAKWLRKVEKRCSTIDKNDAAILYLKAGQAYLRRKTRPEEYRKAYTLLYRASSLKHTEGEASFLLGELYQTGRGVQKRSIREAREWYDKAAKCGHPKARAIMAEYYATLSANRAANNCDKAAGRWSKKAMRFGYEEHKEVPSDGNSAVLAPPASVPNVTTSKNLSIRTLTEGSFAIPPPLPAGHKTVEHTGTKRRGGLLRLLGKFIGVNR